MHNISRFICTSIQLLCLLWNKLLLLVEILIIISSLLHGPVESWCFAIISLQEHRSFMWLLVYIGLLMIHLLASILDILRNSRLSHLIKILIRSCSSSSSSDWGTSSWPMVDLVLLFIMLRLCRSWILGGKWILNIILLGVLEVLWWISSRITLYDLLVIRILIDTVNRCSILMILWLIMSRHLLVEGLLVVRASTASCAII